MGRSIDDVECFICTSTPQPGEPDTDDLRDRVVTVGGDQHDYDELLLTRLDHGDAMLAIPLDGNANMSVVMRTKDDFDTVSTRAYHEVRNTGKYVCSGCAA